ncbi:galactose-1-phosphate uridylyltransferase [Pelotomaculum terephthalicicum JT]|uniref:galactose-1-phosphate uridylyltransferase n=1 Tax=Pelotomaculum TaxID=191373 RepID=UPI0009CAC98B|nr:MULTISPECIES: galactose-1-phosphate uridylyltransferase [Pelotomaculum]MCG9967733.1 galactose-1-phosphate uridylyltransferase [Pelotomaculum terephthalicicum JT]OPX85351.1 MAG: Galactose-1-phosphate uridylyltransferase [Pelotomaculum sp. PtaB.Bin117]OPY62716.1 MAG: Galactose-1-phosphate uridylyltransferase [Pelotomaculum sp. PtaU1.Bin065]
MSEWRKDPIVDRWVIISTERGKRPNDYKDISENKKTHECPLCVGKENFTPPEIMAYREPGSQNNRPGWWVRVVPNKFPALRVEEESSLSQQGIYMSMNGIGAHELIVESPSHEPGLDTQTEKQVEEVIWAWRERSLDLRKDSRLKYIQIFKNTGPVAGASLEHTHSQLIATPLVPVEVVQELNGAREYSSRHGSCVYCDMVSQEIAEQYRVVVESSNFLSFSPFASRFPFETWIVPKEHQYDFGQIREEMVRDLAGILRTTLRKIAIMIRNIPYNVVLHTAPVNIQEEMHYHWHLEIMPRLTIMAGFELGTGYFINPTPPEMAAQALRDTEEFYPLHDGSSREVYHYV